MVKQVLLGGITTAIFLAACPAGAEVSFDRGLDVESFMQEAAETGSSLPTPKARKYNRYLTKDCARFNFGPQSGPALSPIVKLHSQEYIEECVKVPSGPNGQLVEQCYNRPGTDWARTAKMTIAPRRLLSWEQESFEVCLEGSWLSLNQLKTGYKYAVERKGDKSVAFSLTPLEKILSDPDPDGLALARFSYNPDAKTYKLMLADKWASDYAGEKILIRAELRKEVSFWPDSSLGTREFTLDVSDSYAVTIDPGLLVKTAEAGEKAALSERPGKYYIRWGFSRIGKLSRNTFVKKGDTPGLGMPLE